MGESALVVVVAEAEPIVGHLRARLDPAARMGAPAHVTVLYPFIAPEVITNSDIQRVGRVVRQATAFHFRLVAAKCFPDAVYLEPEPAQPFVALTEAIVRKFPQYPPYQGRYASVIPHVTVARGPEPELQALREQLAADPRLQAGVEANCNTVVLLENTSGYWRQTRAFRLRVINN
jgi:2'-5' RNA ligase